MPDGDGDDDHADGDDHGYQSHHGDAHDDHDDDEKVGCNSG